MTHYVNESISKGELSDAKAKEVLMMKSTNTREENGRELRHGMWFEKARLKLNLFISTCNLSIDKLAAASAQRSSESNPSCTNCRRIPKLPEVGLQGRLA